MEKKKPSLEVRRRDLKHLEVCILLTTNIRERFYSKFTGGEKEAMDWVITAAREQYEREEKELRGDEIFAEVLRRSEEEERK